jgi:DNA-binding transcriptional ArsR family regulator
MLKRVAQLDLMFRALADPVRRLMLERLTRGPASVSDLAALGGMSLAGAGQHLRVLEDAGLVVTGKTGRIRTCRIEASALGAVEHWMAERRNWDEKLGRLGDVLAEDRRGRK